MRERSHFHANFIMEPLPKTFFIKEISQFQANFDINITKSL